MTLVGRRARAERRAPAVHPRRLLGASPLLLVALAASLLSGGASADWGSGAADDYQLLTNPSLELFDPAYARFEGVDCQVASGWQRFWYEGPPPCWLDTRVFADSALGTGWVEKIAGDTSQLIVGTQPYSAGIWQRVTGLTPGVAYGFHAAMLTIYQTSAPPATDGTMVKQIGLDPTGGSDPQAGTVVWSEPDDHDEGPWDLDQRLTVQAQGPAMTVFVRVLSPHGSGGLPYLNYSLIDSALLAQAPVVTAVSPVVSLEPAFAVRWDHAVPAPGVDKLRWYDVQWLAEADGVWRDWLVKTDALQAVFAGQRGHSYRFRARVWQKYVNGAHLYSLYSPQGDTRTLVVGSRIVGRVLDAEEHPMAGATVAIVGVPYSATSDRAGRYQLDLASLPAPLTVSVGHPWLPVPEPVYGLTLGLTETVAITWTLRPADDAVINGSFEQRLAGWSLVNAPGEVADPVHTGRAALRLGGARTASDFKPEKPGSTMAVSQTVALSSSWEPVLSFWYRAAAPAGMGPSAVVAPGALEVRLTTVDSSLTPRDGKAAVHPGAEPGAVAAWVVVSPKRVPR